LYKLNIENKNHKIYSFYDENDTGFKIVPTRGGIISELKFEGKEILHRDDNGILNSDGSIRGGMPFLFPICGIVKNTPFKRHGFSRDLPFEVLDTYVNGTQAGIKIIQRESEASLKYFPYKFSVEIWYTIEGQSFKTRTRITNRDEREFMFFSGFHPYFEVSDKNKGNLDIKIPSTKYIDVFNNYNGVYDFNEDEVDVVHQDLTGNKLEIIDWSENTNIKMEYSKEYKDMVVWALKGKDFICIEPWMADMEDLTAENGAILLKPSENMEMEFTIALLTYE
jgi:galactose mutarotase-like enzyme